MDSAMVEAPMEVSSAEEMADSAMVVSLVEEAPTVGSAMVDLKSSTVDSLVVEIVASAMVDLAMVDSSVVETVDSAVVETVDSAVVDSSVVETVDSAVVETVDTATVDSVTVDPELSTEDSLTAETASLPVVSTFNMLISHSET